MGIEENRILQVLCEKRTTKHVRTLERAIKQYGSLQCDEGQSANILIKLLYGQFNKCFADYLKSGSALTN